MGKQLDIAALVAGVCVALFGVVLLLDASGDVHLRFNGLAAIAAFICGATLLAAGLTRRA